MKKLLGLLMFVVGLQSTAVQGMEKVSKDIVPAGLFIAGSVVVPAVVAYVLTANEKKSDAGTMGTEKNITVDKKTPAALHGAVAGLISASLVIGACNFFDSRSAKEKTTISLLIALAFWGVDYSLYMKELEKSESRVKDAVANILGNYGLQGLGAISFVAAYYLVTGKR